MSELELWNTKLLDAGGRIRRLLATDALSYFESAVREAFVAAPSFADELSAEELAVLKAESRASAEAAGEALVAALPDSVWLGAVGEASAEVRAIPAVDAALNELVAGTRAFFKDHGLPGEPPAYALPVRFIDGENLVSLTRALWKAVAQRQTAVTQAAQQAVASSADERRRRWEEA